MDGCGVPSLVYMIHAAPQDPKGSRSTQRGRGEGALFLLGTSALTTNWHS